MGNGNSSRNHNVDAFLFEKPRNGCYMRAKANLCRYRVPALNHTPQAQFIGILPPPSRCAIYAALLPLKHCFYRVKRPYRHTTQQQSGPQFNQEVKKVGLMSWTREPFLFIVFVGYIPTPWAIPPMQANR